MNNFKDKKTMRLRDLKINNLYCLKSNVLLSYVLLSYVLLSNKNYE